MKRLTVGALLIALLPMVPVGPDLRLLLQGDLAEPVNEKLTFAGASSHPLALDPWRGEPWRTWSARGGRRRRSTSFPSRNGSSTLPWAAVSSVAVAVVAWTGQFRVATV